MKQVAILHAYSARNRGDGLLVEQAIEVVRDALGDCEFTIAASDPGSFSHIDARFVGSRPGRRGYGRAYLAFLRSLGTYDLVVGVGGGYLRAGYPLESLKMGLVMGPQLIAASRRRGNTVYLPQSVGPLRFGVRHLIRHTMRKVDTVFLRDDRSVKELGLPNVIRSPDMAALNISRSGGGLPVPYRRPVMSIRSVRGDVPAEVYELASELGEYDVYIQSTVSGNDDRSSSATLTPISVVEAGQLFSQAGPRRVIVAVRLHAALMALEAGHYVVHLAYERKGFGAFSDLGLGKYVHRYGGFDPSEVADQVCSLAESADARDEYDAMVARTRPARQVARKGIVDALSR